MSQECKGTEIVMPTKELKKIADRIGLYFSNLEKRLKQSDINTHFLIGCISSANNEIPDSYQTTGTWQERATGLATAVNKLVAEMRAGK